MMRTLWFVIRTAALVAAAVWVANRPGTVDIHWLGYDIRTQVGFVLLALLIIFVAAIFLYRLISAFLNFPRSWRRYLDYKRRHKGFRSLTLGLTAVAAGDAKLAHYHSYRARRFLAEDKGLTVLLEAQAARLKGEDMAANRHFEKLMENEDTAFLGMRGLLLGALEKDDTPEAAALAHKALELHPRQPWVLRMAYDLELRQGHWDKAHRLLNQAVRHKALDATEAARDRVALLLQEAEELLDKGADRIGLHKLRQAHNADPSFVPAALALARHYLDHGQPKQAASVIERTWKERPHPDLVPLWHDAMPARQERDSAGVMSWYERLVSLRPDHAESHLAAAEAALEHNLWGAARSFMERADSIHPGARLYRLRARLAQALDRPEEAALMLRRAGEEPSEKVWTCRQTGRVYDAWSPIAQPHGSFNTIVWDYPHVATTDSAAGDRSELLITSPSRHA